jgi:hypothetical protein
MDGTSTPMTWYGRCQGGGSPLSRLRTAFPRQQAGRNTRFPCPRAAEASSPSRSALLRPERAYWIPDHDTAAADGRGGIGLALARGICDIEIRVGDDGTMVILRMNTAR